MIPTSALRAVALAVMMGNTMVAQQSASSFYDLKTTTLQGKPADLGAYRGKVTLVVNTASECGYTPQYEALEALHRELAPKGFSVLGFPSNDFGAQEPGTAQDIAEFCRKNYGVTFPMFAKLSTRPGAGQSPIYTFLGAGGQLPAWNFSKYVVGKNGKIVAFFPSAVTPDAPELRAAITKALNAVQ
ncbi:MAG TPA: glutathione peroxidase [Vicinamibacterales bacterium]|nr:glutathione peroxidase [Vicinamibacterales bacterium]